MQGRKGSATSLPRVRLADGLVLSNQVHAVGLPNSMFRFGQLVFSLPTAAAGVAPQTSLQWFLVSWLCVGAGWGSLSFLSQAFLLKAPWFQRLCV